MKSIYALLFTVACCITSQRVLAQGTPGFSGNALFGNQSSGGFYILGATSQNTGPYIEMYGNSFTSSPGTVGYVSGYNANNPKNFSHIFWTPTGPSSYSHALTILQNGNVFIGTHLPTSQADYKLAVEGKLVTQSVYVTAPSTWADFVFEPSYKPMELPALENYLKVNKHLPAVPSAKEVMANGMDMAEMNAKLLQSIEELTLHVITLSKRVQELEASKGSVVGGGK